MISRYRNSSSAAMCSVWIGVRFRRRAAWPIY
jgi:hypothetical protein